MSHRSDENFSGEHWYWTEKGVSLYNESTYIIHIDLQ